MRLNLAGFCFTNETGISFMCDWVLVGTSFVLSAVGSYAALELIGRMRLAAGARARYWQAGSAAVLGGSMWSMHFMAILAINIRLAVSYSGSLTALSLVVATAANGVGLEVCGKKPLTVGRVGAAGTIIGIGIVSTHYMAMAAMIFPGSIAYTPGMWGLSVLIAIGSAVAEVWLSMTTEDALERALAALIIAILMSGMHFAGMAATVFQAGPLQQLDDGVLPAPLATAVAGTTAALVVLALVLVSADRRLPAGRARQSSIQENPTATMARNEKNVSPLGEEPAMLEVIPAPATTAIPGDTASGSHLAEGIMDAPADAGLLQVTQAVSRPARVPFQLAECLLEPVLTCQRGDIVGHYVGALPSISGDSTGNLGPPPHKRQALIMAAAEQIIAREDNNSASGLIFVDLNVGNLLKKPILAMYLRSYKTASPAVRYRLIILLSRWPSDIPSNRVRELAGLLRPVCRSVGFRLDEFAMPKFDFGFFDAPFVAVDARQLDLDRRKNGKLERLVLQLHSKRARLLVREVPSMTAVRKLRSLGVDFVSMETRAAVADTRSAPLRADR